MRSDVQSGMVNILNEDQEITKQEVEGVKEVARKLNLAPDREVLHSIDQLFRVDDRAGVFNPAGQLGKKLVLDVLLIHAMNSAVENTVKVVRDMPLDVKDVAYAGLCSALAVLTPEQKKSGVALLDLGAGTTHVLAYANETLALAQTLDVGGDHITNDIALGLNLPHQQAERLKIESGSALLDARSRSGTLSLAPEGGFSGRKIQEKDLQVIVNARMDETLEMVHDLLKEKGLLSRMGAGLVLTGRGARLKDLVTLSERMFNLPCSIGTPRDIGGMRQIAEGPDYASVVGMLRYAARSAQERPAGWFQSLLKWGRT